MPASSTPPPASEFAPEEPPAEKHTRKPSQHVFDLLEGSGRTSNCPSDPVVTCGIRTPAEVLNIELEGEGQVDWIMATDFATEYVLVAEISETEALEPCTLAEAKCHLNWPLWERAIEEELETLCLAGTWKLAEAPVGSNIVSSKWVFCVKKDAAHNIIWYKAHLIAQGFSQVPDVDYLDTFAPITKLAAICSILAMAAAEDLELHQIDIKGAYLNRELIDREVIYMQQSPGYHKPDSFQLVCWLQKTLYGLKQSGCHWYQKLVDIMLTHLVFQRCNTDQTVFFHHQGRAIIIVLIHINDCTIAATSIVLITDFKVQIARHVKITDFGKLHWLLSIKIKRDHEWRILHLSQHLYINSILHRYGLEDLKPVSIPMDTNIHLSTAQYSSTTANFTKMCDISYHEAVSSLMYAALGTHPDIAFAIQTIFCFMKNPRLIHWDAVKCVFRYLKGTMDWWLTYGSSRMDLTGYMDAKDRHAISGYAFMIHGSAISWSTKQQEIIILSMTEAEYVTITHAAKEAIWLCSFISQVFDIILDPTTLFSDNKSAIELTKDHQYHAWTKHINIHFHFIYYIVKEGSIQLIFCPTDDNTANTFMKALPSTKAKYFMSQLGLLASWRKVLESSKIPRACHIMPPPRQIPMYLLILPLPFCSSLSVLITIEYFDIPQLLY